MSRKAITSGGWWLSSSSTRYSAMLVSVPANAAIAAASRLSGSDNVVRRSATIQPSVWRSNCASAASLGGCPSTATRYWAISPVVNCKSRVRISVSSFVARSLAKRQRRVVACDQHQVQRLRPMACQAGEQISHLGPADFMVIVQHKDEVSRQAGNFAAERCDEYVQRRRLGSQEQSQCLRAGTGKDGAQCGAEVAHKDSQVAVVFVQRQPGDGQADIVRATHRCAARQPRADQRRLAVAGGGADERQSTKDTVVQLLDQARAHDQVCGHSWRVQFCRVQWPRVECRHGLGSSKADLATEHESRADRYGQVKNAPEYCTPVAWFGRIAVVLGWFCRAMNMDVSCRLPTVALQSNPLFTTLQPAPHKRLPERLVDPPGRQPPIATGSGWPRRRDPCPWK